MTPTSKIVTKMTRHFPVIRDAEKRILELCLQMTQMTDAVAKRLDYRLSIIDYLRQHWAIDNI